MSQSLQLRLRDRKSTRLNSSHLGISYAVFCLKKKNTLPENFYDQEIRVNQSPRLHTAFVTLKLDGAACLAPIDRLVGRLRESRPPTRVAVHDLRPLSAQLERGQRPCYP